MEIGSPEDGFDEISAILKDHESTLTEDLDLSFIISKDFSEDYVYDDSTGIDKFNFHLSEQGQSELPSLSSNLGCYDIPGSCTETLQSSTQNGCHNDGLGDANVIDDQKSNFEPWEDQYSQDAHKLFGHYLGDSAIEMGAENVDDEILMDVCLQALEQELNQDDIGYNEEAEHEFQVDQLHKFHSASSNQCHPESKSENVNDSRTSPDAGKKVESAHVDQNDQGRTSQVSVSPDTSSVRQITDDHRVWASNGHNDIPYPNTSPDQIYNQDECYDQNGRTPSMDRLLHAGEQNRASSWDSGQRSQHLDSSSGRYVATPRNHHRKRSRSRSPRQINSRSRRKRKISTNSQESSPYSRESCKKQSKKAAGFHPSPRSQNISSANCHKKVLYSSRSCKRKYGLAGSSDRGREVTSKDHLLDSGSQKLSFQHESNERFLNVTSNHVHASSINHHSHHTRRKVESSVSPSSVPRRDHCFGYKREHSKARSRSPYGRNRQSPRKRYTSRLQSPSRSYISRRRSPEIRYLSQASCSRTGIGKPGTCLFVAGFRFLITERELERKFSPFGRVSNVRIIRDKRSGISRGYGFLSLEGDEEADAAIRALHRTEWNGRIVLVEKSVSN